MKTRLFVVGEFNIGEILIKVNKKEDALLHL